MSNSSTQSTQTIKDVSIEYARALKEYFPEVLEQAYAESGVEEPKDLCDFYGMETSKECRSFLKDLDEGFLNRKGKKHLDFTNAKPSQPESFDGTLSDSVTENTPVALHMESGAALGVMSCEADVEMNYYYLNRSHAGDDPLTTTASFYIQDNAKTSCTVSLVKPDKSLEPVCEFGATYQVEGLVTVGQVNYLRGSEQAPDTSSCPEVTPLR